MRRLLIVATVFLLSNGCKKQINESQTSEDGSASEATEPLTPVEVAALYTVNKRQVVSKVFMQLDRCKSLEKTCNYYEESLKAEKQRIFAEYKSSLRKISAEQLDEQEKQEKIGSVKEATKEKLAAAEDVYKQNKSGSIEKVLEYIRSTYAFSKLQQINKIHDMTPDLIERSVIAGKLDQFFQPFVEGLDDEELRAKSVSASQKVYGSSGFAH